MPETKRRRKDEKAHSRRENHSRDLIHRNSLRDLALKLLEVNQNRSRGDGPTDRQPNQRKMKDVFRTIASVFMIAILCLAFAPVNADIESPAYDMELLVDQSVELHQADVDTVTTGIVYARNNDIEDVIYVTSAFEEPVNHEMIERFPVDNHKYRTDQTLYQHPYIIDDTYRYRTSLFS